MSRRGRAIEPAALAIAAAVTLVLLLLANRYGWHRDEFYYVKSGQHLAWGYVDNPPLTPLIARLATELAPHNLFVLRIFPALVAGVTALLGSVVVRELGGTRTAQVFGAAVVAAGGFVLGVGHLLATPGFDTMAWLALIAITIRMLRTQDPRWWVAFGVVAGIALLNKNLVVMLAVGLGAGLLIDRQWLLLRSRWVAIGALLALVIAAPHLLWQAQHDWPQFEFAQALSERIGGENRLTLVPLQILFVGPAFVALGWRGARWLGGDDEGRTYRALVWAWGVVFVLVLASGGRPYYLVPVTIVVVLAGLVARPAALSTRPLVAMVAVNALVSGVLGLPLLPAASAEIAASVNETVAETIGWRELAQQVRDVVPEGDVIILAGSYGEAGALDFYRDEFGLPPVYSPHNSYADFGQPTDDDAVVVTVRFDATRLARFFSECEKAATVDNSRDIVNEVYGTPIFVCRGLRQPWSVTWEKMRFFA